MCTLEIAVQAIKLVMSLLFLVQRKPEREEQELEVLEAKKIRSEDDCSSNLDKTINGSSQTEINAAGEGCPAEQAVSLYLV